MRSLAWALLLLSCVLLTSGREPERHVIHVTNAGELMELLATPLNDVIVQLAPGTYELVPTQSLEPSMEYCGENSALVPTTIGLTITGRKVTLRGTRDAEAVITTTADYRLRFNECHECEIDHVTIAAKPPAGGSRVDGAAIIVTHSTVAVTNCRIDNASIMEESSRRNASGILGAEAVLEVEFNEIYGSQFGLVLSQRTEAIIKNNLIEGYSAPRNVVLGSAVVMGCGSKGIVERNHLRNLETGIHVLKGASLELRANIIEDIHDSGIGAADCPLDRVVIERNVMYRCGGPGIAICVDGDQRATRNLIVETGRLDPQLGAIKVWGASAAAAVRKNTLYDNTVTAPALDRDVPREIFWRERRGWTRTYRNTPVGVDGRHKFHESAFLTRYGRWLN
jgi:hypothetical protein